MLNKGHMEPYAMTSEVGLSRFGRKTIAFSANQRNMQAFQISCQISTTLIFIRLATRLQIHACIVSNNIFILNYLH